MKTKVELLDEIVKKQDERMKFMEELFDLYDESEIIDNSYTTYYSIKNKLKLNNIEITDLKSQLAKAGEEKKECSSCKWFEIGYGHCVWCVRDSSYKKELSLKTSGYTDKWQPR